MIVFSLVFKMINNPAQEGKGEGGILSPVKEVINTFKLSNLSSFAGVL